MKRIRLIVSAFLLSITSLLAVVVPHAFAATNTWTGAGADTKMSTAGNWSGGTPSAGDDLVFPANITKLTVVNDLTAATSFNSITFSGAATAASDYTISGNSMTLVAGISNTMTGTEATYQTINTPLVVGGDSTFTAAANTGGLTFGGAIDLGASALTIDGNVTMNGIISGTGSITKTGTDVLVLGGANTYSGTTTVNTGTLILLDKSGLGTTDGGTTVASGASLDFIDATAVTYTEPLTVGGTGVGGYGALRFGNNYGAGGGSTPLPYVTSVLSGALTLTADTSISPNEHNVKITGAISGSHAIAQVSGSSGSIEIASSSNGSTTANGTLMPAVKTTTYSDAQPTTSISVNTNETAVVTGSRGDVLVKAGGTLKGTGTVGDVIIYGTLAPGMSPGCLNSGNLSFQSGSTYQFEVGGTDACTGYDQIKVTGTVQVSGKLNVSRYNKFVPKTGQKYVIISNDGTDKVSGTFDGLAQGATFKADGVTFSISYTGGDGNDVELTVTGVSPDTGFALLTGSPAVTIAATFGAAAVIALIARRQFRTAFAARRRR